MPKHPELREDGDNTVLRAAQWLYQHTNDAAFLKSIEGGMMECAVVNFNKVMREHERA